jgi:hypothetical protein
MSSVRLKAEKMKYEFEIPSPAINRILLICNKNLYIFTDLLTNQIT